MMDCGPDISSVQCAFINIGIYISYALIIVATVLAIVFPLMYAAKHIKETKKSFIAIGILIAIVLISMVFPLTDLSTDIISDFDLTSGAISWVHIGIYTSYIFMALATLTLVADLTITTVKSK